MKRMTVSVLGTGTSQGVPVIACSCPVCQSQDAQDKRLRTAVMVKTLNNVIVIDAGPDFRQQMLREKVERVDALLITHNHKDHTGGLDDVRAFNWVLQKPMDIYASPEVLKTIRKDFSYAFEADRYPGVPQMNLHALENQSFEINTDTIIPIRALHAQMPVYGFRIGDFSYLTDANYLEDRELDKMRHSKVLIINALRKEKHYSHFNLAEALALVRELKPEKAFITHISHQMGFHKEVSKELPAGVALAHDGLQIVL
jgi:phosphoribosyl 1,2-cyclic phosphate phosphodiesterase